MDHLIIAFYISGLIAGIVAAYYLFNQKKVYEYAFLKTYIYNIVFLNLIIFTKIISSYYRVNIFLNTNQSTDLATLHLALDIIWISSQLIELFASIGLAYTFLKIIFEIQDIPLGRKAKYGLISCIAVSSIIFGICVAEFVYNENFIWLSNFVEIAEKSLGVVIIISFTAALIRGKPDLKSDLRSFLISLTTFYLICLPLLIINDSINYQNNQIVESVIILIINIFPLFWVKFIISRYSSNAPHVLFSKINIDNLVSLHNISPREREIFELILKGYSNIEIQNELFISPHTVKNHNYNIYKKLGIRSRGELIRKVMDSENGS